MRRPALATLALSLLALLFGWETRLALQEAHFGPDNVASATTGAWQPGVPAPDPQPPPDPTPAAAAVAARPLFRPDRLPFREQAASPVAARNYESELSRFTLLGVFGFGEEPVGVVTGKTGNKTDRWELKAGDVLPGFAVKEVGIDGMRLTADGREFLLPLYAGAPTAATGALRTEAPRPAAARPPSPGTPSSAPGPAATPAPPTQGAPATYAPATPSRATSTPESQPPRSAPMGTPRFLPGRR